MKTEHGPAEEEVRRARRASRNRSLDGLREEPVLCRGVTILRSPQREPIFKEACLITLTEEARRYVRTASNGARLPGGLVFRLDRTKTGRYGEPSSLAVTVDEPREGDQPIEHEGEGLLHISGAVSVAYDGSVLDLEETPWGTVFILVDPPGSYDVRGREQRTLRSSE